MAIFIPWTLFSDTLDMPINDNNQIINSNKYKEENNSLLDI